MPLRIRTGERDEAGVRLSEHAPEHLALDRARGGIRALANLAPTGRVLRDDRIMDMPVGTPSTDHPWTRDRSMDDSPALLP